MIDENREELATLHALDLLEGEELAQFKLALESDEELQALVRTLRDTTASLAYTAPAAEPPAALRERVLASIAGHSPSFLTATPAADTGRRHPLPAAVDQDRADHPGAFLLFRRFAPWALAACLALTSGWFAQLYLASRGEAGLLRQEQALAEVALQSALNQLEAERIVASRRLSDLEQQLRTQGDLANYKITALASMLNNSPQALAVAVWDPGRQSGVLQVEKLPALAADQDYQLWVVDPQYPSPVDGGVFTVDPATGAARFTFKSKQPVKTIDAFAVTLERKGGVPKAEGPFVLLGK